MDKIERLDVSAYTIPLDEPESDGTFTWYETTVIVVEPFAGGQRALGYTYGTPALVKLIGDVLTEVVVGRDPLDVIGTWDAMVKRVRNLGRPGLASMAIAGVDISLWDLKARLLDVALCDLLGAVRHEVPVYGSGGFTSLTLDQLRSQLGVWAHGDGIPRVKMKVGTSWGREWRADLERAAIAREAIGDDTELYVDANGGYTRKQALRLAPSYADLGVTWFEEPVSSDDLDGLRVVREQTPIDVAAGEYGYDLVYFRRMAASTAVDVLQADVSRCAGITEWLRAAAVAAAHGLDVSGHCAPSLHAHPACAVPNLRHLELFADHVRADRMLFDGVLDPTGGVLRPDRSRPGMGLQLRRDDAAQWRVA